MGKLPDYDLVVAVEYQSEGRAHDSLSQHRGRVESKARTDHDQHGHDAGSEADPHSEESGGS